MCELISDTIVKAKKSHRCYHCGGEIARGQKYRRVIQKDDCIQVWKDHLDCALAARAYHRLSRLNWDEGVCLKNDLTYEDAEWIAEKFPGVAMRLGFVVTPFC